MDFFHFSARLLSCHLLYFYFAINTCMGKGKTTYVIDLMRNSASYKKYIYITPFLHEVERVRKAVAKQKFEAPDEQKGHGSKYRHFRQLVEEGANIVTTHALFKKVDERLLGLLKREHYTLIVDEVFEVINKVGFTGLCYNSGHDDKIEA